MRCKRICQFFLEGLTERLQQEILHMFFKGSIEFPITIIFFLEMYFLKVLFISIYFSYLLKNLNVGPNALRTNLKFTVLKL